MDIDNPPQVELSDILEEIKQLNLNFSSEQEKNTNILSQILLRIDKLEKTYVSINADLINQNIKMSELLNGKLEEPEFEMPESAKSKSEQSEGEQRTKELFYYEKNGQFAIHGPGTFDNKSQIKSLGSAEWNSINKTWDVVTTKEKILETFPNIIEKSK
jgi:hypothetical protein